MYDTAINDCENLVENGQQLGGSAVTHLDKMTDSFFSLLEFKLFITSFLAILLLHSLLTALSI